MLCAELECGVNGFYVNGATGEGLFLPENTRREMAEVAVSVCRGKGVVIDHIGAVDTQSALSLARHAGEIGCDAVSSLVPNYVTQYSTDQILDYYKRVADISGLPVLVYCTGLVGNDPYSFMEKAIRVKGIIGCKFTMTNFYDMHRITCLNGGDINVLNGPDEMLICGLTMGADGGIGSTYNLMPKRYLKLYRAFTQGDLQTARQIQFGINKVIEVLIRHGVIASIKRTLTEMGFDAGSVAYPGKVIGDAEAACLMNELREAGYDFDFN